MENLVSDPDVPWVRLNRQGLVCTLLLTDAVWGWLTERGVSIQPLPEIRTMLPASGASPASDSGLLEPADAGRKSIVSSSARNQHGGKRK